MKKLICCVAISCLGLAVGCSDASRNTKLPDKTETTKVATDLVFNVEGLT